MEAIQFKRAELEIRRLLRITLNIIPAEAVREHLPMFISGPDNIR